MLKQIEINWKMNSFSRFLLLKFSYKSEKLIINNMKKNTQLKISSMEFFVVVKYAK